MKEIKNMVKTSSLEVLSHNICLEIKRFEIRNNLGTVYCSRKLKPHIVNTAEIKVNKVNTIFIHSFNV